MNKRIPLARKNLFHKKARLLAALAGVSFSVILVNMQVGILLGMLANASAFMDRLPNEIWIIPKGTTNFDQARLLSEQTFYRAKSVEGVLWAEKMIVSWSNVKKHDGGYELVEVVGMPPGGRIKLPWKVDPSAGKDLVDPRGAIIDRAEMKRLMVENIGDTFEVGERKVKIVGFTEGMRSFTTAPYVVMRFEKANQVQMVPGAFQFVLVKKKEGTDLRALQSRLRKKIKNAEVLTTSDFRLRAYIYWVFGTGIGSAFFMAAGLGFVVGGAVVGQVLYAIVVEQRAEFGVLKAMGATNAYLCRIVLTQALIAAIAGYITGYILTVPVVYFLHATGTPIVIPWPLMVACLVSVISVCLLSAILPIVQIIKLEPALVFRG